MSNAIRWSEEQLKNHRARQLLDAAAKAPTPAPPNPAPAKRSKYAAEKVDQGGLKFDSKKEARRWDELERMAAAGRITDLKRQQSFVLAPAVRLHGEPRKKPAIRYFSDFSYVMNGQLVVEDTKSRPTRKLAAYRMKKHLMATVHGIHIKEN
jgi:hypothetical protein